MNYTDVWSLILGAVLGLLLTLFIQPLLEDRVQGLLVRTVARFWIRRRESLAGRWASVMLRDEVPLSRSEEICDIVLSEVRNRIAGVFTWKGRSYRLLGKRHTDQYLTGTYEDIRTGNTFHGAFQLRVLPNERVMVGRWVGFNTANEIIDGPWEWRRDTEERYPFELTRGSS